MLELAWPWLLLALPLPQQKVSMPLAEVAAAALL